MKLRGQQTGYAMVTLLIGLSIMAVMMTAVMPVWRQMAQREKEAELVFRGEQYARAIGLFQRKGGPGVLPPSFDVLVEQRFLRKKFKDPITNDDFAPISLNAVSPSAGQTTPTPGSAPGSPLGSPFGGGPQGAGGGGGQRGPGGTAQGGATVSGIAGVTSKSKATSIRLYKGRNHYNEWLFIFTPPAPAPGAGGAPGGAPGVGAQRGRGTQPPGAPQGPPPFGGVGGRQGNPGGRGANPNGPPNPGAPNPNGPGRGGAPPFGPFRPPGR